jgi:RNA polymerase sigma factor (sigma-70 family)
VPLSTDPSDPYSQHSETIKQVIDYVCRRHRLPPDKADDLESWVNLRLIENDYAVLREYKGLSKLRTYLHSVVINAYLDWRNAEWGRFRYSAAARRLGVVAMELERLVLRDKRDYEDAVQTLVSTGVTRSREECDRLWAQLKRRSRRTEVPADEFDDRLQEPVDPLQWLDFDDPQRMADRVGRVLAESLRGLPPQEQVILRLWFVDEFTVPQIARALGFESKAEEKALYRRIERSLKNLGEVLTAAGLTAEQTLELLDNPNADLGEILRKVLEKPETGPSNAENAGGGA